MHQYLVPAAVIGGILLTIIILGVAIWLIRSAGKNKKNAAPGAAGSGAGDWSQQQMNQQGMPGGWQNQAGAMGAADNQWAQQQGGGWNAPAAQQQAGGWGAPQQQQSQPQQGGWGTPSPQQQQAAPGNWGAPAAQQQAGTWAAPQQQAQQQPQQGAWGASPSPQPAANSWGTPPPQPAANSWGTPPPQQPPTSPWGASQAQQPGAWGAAGSPAAGQPVWDPTIASSQAASPDSWGQAQAGASAFQQPGAPAWNMPGSPSSPAPQPAASPFGSGGSGPSWGQPAPSAPSDPWAQQAAPAQQGAWSQPFQPPAPNSSPLGGSPAIPSWQQQGGFGTPAGAPGMMQDATVLGGNDNDRTILRPSGPQGTVGSVSIAEGKDQGRVYEIRKNELSIGRSRESDIFLEDLAVSRLHAKILNMGNGVYALKDEGSANGTKVNGQLVNKYQTYTLQEGDKIQLGQTVLVFARN
jgi:hypothetical protein